MQYALLTHRHLQPDPNMDSKSLLYFYSSYRKEREEAAQKQQLLAANKSKGKKYLR